MKLLIANWKMNPKTEAQAIALAKASDAEGVVVCPPFPFLPAVKKVLKQAALGAQDAFFEDEGAFTGQVSPKQLKDLGVSYVIVGHSERRALGDTNEMIAKKVAAVIKSGLTPILCIGESRNERATGRTKEIVERQLELGLSLIAASKPAKVIITYEPVWAISGGDPLSESDTPENAAEMIAYLRDLLKNAKVRPTLIYGGSANAQNSVALFNQKEIEGLLVGRASTTAEFKAMIKAAAHF
jgi:triosephosphate isomerase